MVGDSSVAKSSYIFGRNKLTLSDFSENIFRFWKLFGSFKWSFYDRLNWFWLLKEQKTLDCLGKIYNGFIITLSEIWEEIWILETFLVIQMIFLSQTNWVWLLKEKKIMDSWLPFLQNTFDIFGRHRNYSKLIFLKIWILETF